MFELIYEIETKRIIKAEVVIPNVFTAAHPDFYTTLQFGTEAEMKDYIEQHGLEALNEIE